MLAGVLRRLAFTCNMRNNGRFLFFGGLPLFHVWTRDARELQISFAADFTSRSAPITYARAGLLPSEREACWRREA
jgi:hypothetical protein